MNQKKIKRLKEIALALYPPGFDLRCYHVTFILRKGKIVTIGLNNSKTNTKNLKYDYFASNGDDLRRICGTHSEISSLIRGGREDYSNFDFVNIRLDRQGKLLYSRPCRGCSSALQQVGFRRFYYTERNGEMVEYNS